MEIQKMKLTARLHPLGGITLHRPKSDAFPDASTNGRATTAELLKAIFSEKLGLHEQAECLSNHPWPKKGTVDIEFSIRETEETLRELGFDEVGERGA